MTNNRPQPESRRPWRLQSRLLVTLAVLVGLLVLTAASTAYSWHRVVQTQTLLRNQIRPAQVAAANLTTAFVDQEAGQQGYLMTGDASFLAPYTAGRESARQSLTKLERLLAFDEESVRLLADVKQAGREWQVRAAEPEIAARSGGALTTEQLRSMAASGTRYFEPLRERLAAVQNRTAVLTAAQLAKVGAAQTVANVVAGVAVVLALAVGAAAVVLMRRRVHRPLANLLVQVRTIADGDYEHRIVPHGPQELRSIADAVDRMRKNMLNSSEQLVAAQNQITVMNVHDRIAAHLHDLTIQRVFALGLMLQSAAGRQPQLAADLSPLIDETDRIIRELRGIIFEITPDRDVAGLRGRVTDLVQDSSRSLGFTPELAFHGPVDDNALEPMLPDLLATLREALSNAARHAHASAASVEVSVAQESLRLTVTDNGMGISAGARMGNGLNNFRARAERLGGRSTVESAPGAGTTLDWCVPIEPPAGEDATPSVLEPEAPAAT